MREVLADLRRNTSDVARLQELFGRDAVEDLPPPLVPGAGRLQHVLSPLRVELEGDVLDLRDVGVRDGLERRYSALLAAHDLEHLDLHELTAPTREVTRTIAGDAWDDGVAASGFPPHATQERALPCSSATHPSTPPGIPSS